MKSTKSEKVYPLQTYKFKYVIFVFNFHKSFAKVLKLKKSSFQTCQEHEKYEINF